jgi:nitrogen regulatory protein PII
MYVITANISVGAIDEMRDALLEIGVPRMRMAAINGYTSGHDREIVYRGVKHVLSLFPEVELEAVVEDEAVDRVVNAIMKTSRHLHGDGYVVVTPVDQCYRIRTGIREL